MVINKIIEFYINNRQTVNIIIATAFISSLVTWLFTKLLPSFGSFFSKLSDKLIQKIGGQFAYHAIQGKYLNWVILHNQDLNLTGIIGTGQKPRLEQVFISLKMTRENKTEEKQTNQSTKINETEKSVKIKGWLGNYWAAFNDSFSGFFSGKKSRSQQHNFFYQAKGSWKIRQVFSRDYFGEASGFAALIVFPFVILLAQYTAENPVSSSLYILLAVSFIVGIYLFRDYKDKSSLFIYSFLPIFLIILKFVLLVIYSIFPLYLLIGLATGIILIIYTFREEIFPSKHKNERLARDVGNLVSNFDNIAILGKPGSGKSTYAQFIALTFAQERAGSKKLRNSGVIKRKFGINEWYLPILIPLRKVSKYINPSNLHAAKNICIEAFKHEVLPANLREILSDSYISYMLTKKKCILLFDGLDEVSNEEHFRVIVNEIQGLVSQYPGNKFVVTSRHIGWRGGISSAFQITEVKDLDNDQIYTFAFSWYKSIEVSRQLTDPQMDEEEKKFREERARVKAEQLIDAISNNENIRNLARNPLLLSMICYVHYNKTLPKERLSLYEDCSRLLLEQWDIEKGLPQDDIPLTYVRKEIIMQEIAYTMHSGKSHKETGVREINADEIIQVIRKVLLGFNLDESQADVYFNKLVARTGLIISTEQYKNLYGFSHQTFQEFYTAKYLSRHNINIFRDITDEDNVESQERLSSWWREVIILHSGMEKDISAIINSLCCNTSRDYLRNRIQIAAQCFAASAESPHFEEESVLFTELLRIRSAGEIPESRGKINSIGKKYLLNFASSSSFYYFALRTRLKDITDQKGAIFFAEELLKLVKSPDRTIKSACLSAFLEIAKRFDISVFITEEIIGELVNEAGAKIILIDILNLLDNIHQPLSGKLLNIISETCIEIFDGISSNYKGNFENDLDFCKFLKIISGKSLINNSRDVNGHLANIFAKIFEELPAYRRDNFPFRYALSNYFSCLIQFMISVGESIAEKEFVKSQLMNMLRTGNSMQREWSVLILGKVLNSDNNVIEAIYNELYSPNKFVRLCAISTLRHLNLDDDLTGRIQTKYREVVKERSKLQKFWLLFKEILFGSGALGDTEEERIQIAGSLLSLNNSLGIKNLINYQTWSDIYRYRYEWSDLLRDISRQLSEEDVEGIAKDLVTIASIPDKDIDFIDNILDKSNKIHDHLLNKLLDQLYDDTRSGAIGLLSSFKPKIELNTKEYNTIKEGLLKDTWGDANGSYNILEDNKLLLATIYSD